MQERMPLCCSISSNVPLHATFRATGATLHAFPMAIYSFDHVLYLFIKAVIVKLAHSLLFNMSN
jgi:hypothetical protein